MSVEITTADTFDTVVVQGEIDEVVAQLNTAIREGDRWVSFAEAPHGNIIAFDTKFLRRVRDVDELETYRG